MGRLFFIINFGILFNILFHNPSFYFFLPIMPKFTRKNFQKLNLLATDSQSELLLVEHAGPTPG